MFILQQLESTGLFNVNWDKMTIPSLLGLGIVLLVYEVINQRKSLKEKDARIQELNDKRLEDVREYGESLRETNEESHDLFNKVMIALEILKATNNAGK